MKKFIIRLLFFTAPLLLIIIPPLLALISSKENFQEINGLIESNPKYLIGYIYNECNYKYLKSETLKVHPKNEVVALGSSRVLQFRSRMFNTSFYNAGYTIESIGDFMPFLQAIPKNKYPKYLIIGLDQWMFNKNWDNLSQRKTPDFWTDSFNKNPDSKIYISIIKDLYARKYNPIVSDSDKEIRKIGLNAIVNNTGFRNDGSMYYGKQIGMLQKKDTAAADYHYSDTFDRIATGSRRFQFGDAVNPDALQELNELLNFCSKNNIYVVGFIPPFADKVNEKINQSGKFGYMRNIYTQTLPYFKKHNYEFYDFTQLKSFNSSDNETIDGYHASEVAYLKMLISMLEKGSALTKTTNLDRLEQDLRERTNDYNVYK